MTGNVLPLLVGVFAIPILISELGEVRFGVLAIFWAVIGYFSIFDFGLGRAVTKLVAEKIGEGKLDKIPSLIWAAILLLGLVAITSTVTAYFLAHSIVTKWLKIEPLIQPEALLAFKVLAISIPVVVFTALFRAGLEAYQRFDIINCIRIPLGLITFLGPVVVLSFTTSLVVIVIVLLVGRFVGLMAYIYFFLDTIPEIKQGLVLDKEQIKSLLKYGGWMTLINLIAPLILYLDRFFIGSMMSMESVTFYVAPFEVVTKLSIFPMALIAVLFPAFSTLVSANKEKAVVYYGRGIQLVFYLIFPMVLIITLFAEEGISSWLGKDFAVESAIVLKWLAFGVLINCVGRIPFVFIQSMGRPDIPAKLFLVELPIYCLTLWFVIGQFGIIGVTAVWVFRIVVDTVAFLITVYRLMPETSLESIKITMKLLCGMCLLLLLICIDGITEKLVFLLFFVPIYCLFVWYYGIETGEKKKLLSLVKYENKNI